MKTTIGTTLLMGVVALVLIGCQCDPQKDKDRKAAANAACEPKIKGDEMWAEDEAPHHGPGRFAMLHAAAGARADSTLYASHFDCDTINSLGEAKLESMLQDDEACTPMVVYVTAGAGDGSLDKRKKSVTTYLKDRGMLDTQIKLVDGPNPNSVTPAEPNLANLKKTDTGTAPVGPGETSPTGGGSQGYSGTQGTSPNMK